MIKVECSICGEPLEFCSQEEFDDASAKSGPEIECPTCQKKWGPEK